MNTKEFHTGTGIRGEIASLAARMIAEDGADYSSAKRKAAKHLLGTQKVRGDSLPDNREIEQAVREYQALFQADTQPQRLRHLRMLAAEMMIELAPFYPFLTGAVFNGTASEHSDIHLHLFADNCKDVAIFLLNKNVQYEVTEQSGARHEPIEILSFFYKKEAVHLSLYDRDDIKAGGRQERASLEQLQAMLASEETK